MTTILDSRNYLLAGVTAFFKVDGASELEIQILGDKRFQRLFSNMTAAGTNIEQVPQVVSSQFTLVRDVFPICNQCALVN